jgi:hypothetical protein
MSVKFNDSKIPMNKKSRTPDNKITDPIQEDSSLTRNKLLRKKPWSED